MFCFFFLCRAAADYFDIDISVEVMLLGDEDDRAKEDQGDEDQEDEDEDDDQGEDEEGDEEEEDTDGYFDLSSPYHQHQQNEESADESLFHDVTR